MRSMFKASVAALGVVCGTSAFADGHSTLEGTLRIISDMSNPAPRAVMEGLAAQFDEMHPNLEVELEIVDREAWKTQIRNALAFCQLLRVLHEAGYEEDWLIIRNLRQKNCGLTPICN